MHIATLNYIHKHTHTRTQQTDAFSHTCAHTNTWSPNNWKTMLISIRIHTRSHIICYSIMENCNKWWNKTIIVCLFPCIIDTIVDPGIFSFCKHRHKSQHHTYVRPDIISSFECWVLLISWDWIIIHCRQFERWLEHHNIICNTFTLSYRCAIQIIFQLGIEWIRSWIGAHFYSQIPLAIK